jgi:hypothetical protein
LTALKNGNALTLTSQSLQKCCKIARRLVKINLGNKMEINSADIIAAGLKTFGKWGVMFCEGQYLCENDNVEVQNRQHLYARHIEAFGYSANKFSDRYFLFDTAEEATKFYEFFNQRGITYAKEYAMLFNDVGVTVDENT